MNPRILFLLKYRHTYDHPYGDDPTVALSSGLLNSASFVVEMLQQEGYEVKLAQVIDNNSIDREVHDYKPTHVIIEALWVVPEKFEVLQKLHPHVKWIIRGHSELPFLSNEGIAIDWLCRYVHHKNVYIAANSERSTADFRRIIHAANPNWSERKLHEKVLLLPNWYPLHAQHPHHKRDEEKDENLLDIACFGAIRPLKNQLIQAVAAIEYADIMGKTLRFHMNAGRCEQKGDSVLRNIESLFKHTPKHSLVKHGWLEHKDFVRVLGKMDIGMQVSLSETFNIVTADMLVVGLPIVVSPEVTWACSWSQAQPTSTDDIVNKLLKVNDWRLRLAIRIMNMRGLRAYCNESVEMWHKFLQRHDLM